MFSALRRVEGISRTDAAYRLRGTKQPAETTLTPARNARSKPQGSIDRIVLRPEFRQRLADLANGVIDGVIFYDLDRLVRQRQNLEALIDVEQWRTWPREPGPTLRRVRLSLDRPFADPCKDTG
ncbi:recombinase family protein [Streptomyces inhibens]|uniref:recombinase family protein n=1 Tax=Streptomyces inhibens TaxID=2293571 RepID=UPI0037A3DD25